MVRVYMHEEEMGASCQFSGLVERGSSCVEGLPGLFVFGHFADSFEEHVDGTVVHGNELFHFSD